MNELLALKVIRELAAAEEVYRECIDCMGHDFHATMLAKCNMRKAGDKARAFLIEFDDK